MEPEPEPNASCATDMSQPPAPPPLPAPNHHVQRPSGSAASRSQPAPPPPAAPPPPEAATGSYHLCKLPTALSMPAPMSQPRPPPPPGLTFAETPAGLELLTDEELRTLNSIRKEHLQKNNDLTYKQISLVSDSESASRNAWFVFDP
jgi:hypothetical protein